MANGLKPISRDSEIVSNELLVKFNDGTSKIEIDNIIKNCNGELIKILEGINVYHLKITTPVAQGIPCFQKSSSVKYAEPNRVVRINKSHKGN